MTLSLTNPPQKITQGDAALKILAEFYPRITRDIREMARLAISPNFSSATLQKNFSYPQTLCKISLYSILHNARVYNAIMLRITAFI